MATERRVRSGVSFDQELIDTIDKRAEPLKELGVTRSEVVNAILEEYFEDNGTREAVLAVIMKMRARKRS